MADNDIRVCRRCREIWIEDSVMYEDPDTCPYCGASANAGERLARAVTGVDDGEDEFPLRFPFSFS